MTSKADGQPDCFAHCLGAVTPIHIGVDIDTDTDIESSHAVPRAVNTGSSVDLGSHDAVKCMQSCIPVT